MAYRDELGPVITVLDCIVKSTSYIQAICSCFVFESLNSAPNGHNSTPLAEKYSGTRVKYILESIRNTMA